MTTDDEIRLASNAAGRAAYAHARAAGATTKEAEAASMRARRAADPDRHNAKDRARYRENPERKEAQTAGARARYAADPERHNAKDRAWYRANLARKKANDQAWAQANPEKVRAIRLRHFESTTPAVVARIAEITAIFEALPSEAFRSFYAHVMLCQSWGKGQEILRRALSDPRLDYVWISLYVAA